MTASQLIHKWQSSPRNSALALSDLESLGPDYDTEECMAALEAYRDIERCDYGDREEYMEARDGAWDAVIEAMEDLIE